MNNILDYWAFVGNSILTKPSYTVERNKMKTKKKITRNSRSWKAEALKLAEELKRLKYETSPKDTPQVAEEVCGPSPYWKNNLKVEPLVLILTPEEQNSKILLAAFHTFVRCIEKLKSKNKDYARLSDEFSNFHDPELALTLNTAGVYFDTTKLSIRNLVKTKVMRYLNLSARHSEPLNEPLSDTREDMINYLCIEKAWEDRY